MKSLEEEEMEEVSEQQQSFWESPREVQGSHPLGPESVGTLDGRP
jgi:hypothetical protein